MASEMTFSDAPESVVNTIMALSAKCMISLSSMPPWIRPSLLRNGLPVADHRGLSNIRALSMIRYGLPMTDH